MATKLYVGEPIETKRKDKEKRYLIKFGDLYSSKEYCLDMALKMMEVLKPFPGVESILVEVDGQ